MAVVTDGSGNPTNLRTDEDAAAWRAKNGSYRPYPGPGWDKPNTSNSGDPEAARRMMSGVGFGGTGGSKNGNAPPTPDNVKFQDSTGLSASDWRIRVSIHPSSKILYYAEKDPGIVGVLKNTDGVIFPYVPSVTVSHMANYGSTPLTHANYANYFYESSQVSAISINADFTVQNQPEAAYFLAAVYFFRACTKMFYGDTNQYQGSPPPIVYLDGYGAHYLPHVPCVVTSFTHTMPPDVDYMEVTTSRPGAKKESSSSSAPVIPGINASATTPPPPAKSNSQTTDNYKTRVPTASQFQLTLQPVYSRMAQRLFSYESFAKGDLISKSGSGGYL
jgi:hypothetical protein